MQRGRKSKAALEVVPVGPLRRPRPPADLTEHEKAEWHAVVGDMPVDWFTPRTHGLLKDFCRHRARSDMLAKLIEGFGPRSLADPDGLKMFRGLLMEARAEAKSASDLAIRMRLTQSSLMRPDTATTATQNSATNGARPWAAVA